MRTLAIDFGARRIGLALSDAGGQWATPHSVLTVTDPAQAMAPLQSLIHQEAIQRLVVGLPLNMDDTLGPAARSAISFARQLLATLTPPPQLVFVDERLSSFAAEQRLTERKRRGERMTRQDKKSRLDAHAAAGFLQEYLDGRLPPIAVD